MILTTWTLTLNQEIVILTTGRYLTWSYETQYFRIKPSLRTQTYFRLSLVPPKTTDSRKYVCVRRLDETRLRTWYVLQFYSFFLCPQEHNVRIRIWSTLVIYEIKYYTRCSWLNNNNQAWTGNDDLNFFSGFHSTATSFSAVQIYDFPYTLLYHWIACLFVTYGTFLAF